MEIKFITEGMACAKCEARVVEKLSSLPGVTAVKACACLLYTSAPQTRQHFLLNKL